MTSSETHLANSQTTKKDDSKGQKTSRRAFVRQVGKHLLLITVVGWVATSSKTAFACGEGVSDSTCGKNHSSDATCQSMDEFAERTHHTTKMGFAGD